MSEEKLYVVKNDDGKYWNFADRDGFFESDFASCSATDDERYTKNVVRDHGGHVVTLVEEPKKVVLNREQAKIVDAAHDDKFPACYISSKSDDEELLMNAYVNGYTVKKDKKYRVITPKSWWASENEPEYMHMNVPNGIENYKGADDDTLFTQKQLDLYELNGAPFTKEEVTDDEQ
ncbi:DUF1642 domain-containing protein (plasmid) [Lacticaseibacillus paracasei]|uniref:DUF1642 domain-containing protein n=1 Tax=Lacticaseibacillus paracasei TaxID=1597 RepID=UPI0035936AAE